MEEQSYAHILLTQPSLQTLTQIKLQHISSRSFILTQSQVRVSRPLGWQWWISC